jgi:hypothetical protein
VAADSSETPVTIYQTTWCHIPEDSFKFEISVLRSLVKACNKQIFWKKDIVMKLFTRPVTFKSSLTCKRSLRKQQNTTVRAK